MELNKLALSGKVVLVQTCTKTTKVKKSDVKAWLNYGYDFFKKAENGDKLMIEGVSKGKPRYTCINFCKISVV